MHIAGLYIRSKTKPIITINTVPSAGFSQQTLFDHSSHYCFNTSMKTPRSGKVKSFHSMHGTPNEDKHKANPLYLIVKYKVYLSIQAITRFPTPYNLQWF